MIIEIFIILTLIASGTLLLRALGLKSWLSIPLGLLVSMVIYTVFVYLQIFSTKFISPIAPLLLTAVTASFVVVYMSVRNKQNVLPPLLPSVITVLIISGLVAVFYEANLVRYHYDSFRYLMTGSIIFNGDMEFISTNLLDKRLSTVSAIHSLGHFADNFYLRSVTPLVSLSVLALLIGFLKLIVQDIYDKKLYLVFAVFAGLLAATNYSYIFHSFYLNGHLFIAAFILTLAACTILLTQPQISKSKPPLTTALIAVAATMLVGLVFTRVEGFIYAAIGLVPLVVSPGILPTYKRLLALSVGLAIVLSQSVNIIVRYQQGGDISKYSLALLFLGIVVMALSHFADWKLLYKNPRFSLIIAGAGAAFVLTALFVRDTSVLIDSLVATYHNVMVNLSPWGFSLVILITMFMACLFLASYKNRMYLTFTIIGFFIAVFVVAYLRGSPYRVASADSLNRMLIQIVPLLILFIVTSLYAKSTPKHSMKKLKKPSSKKRI